jgi:hypothetical protein
MVATTKVKKAGSLVLAFYNDLPLLRALLDALETQYTGQFEVLIADDGSKPAVVAELNPVIEQNRRLAESGRKRAGDLAHALKTPLALLRTLPGLETCVMLRPAYAVDNDILPATQLEPSLETKRVRGLFSAGQAYCEYKFIAWSDFSSRPNRL